MRRWIWVAVLVFVVVVPGALLLRKKRMASDLDAYLAEAGWRQTTCPDGDPFGHRDMNEVHCYLGHLSDGRPVSLLLGTRWRSESANIPKGSGMAQDAYIGLGVAADDRWLDAWKARLGRGGADPVRASRVGGEVVVVWRGLHRSEDIAQHLQELERSPVPPPGESRTLERSPVAPP